MEWYELIDPIRKLSPEDTYKLFSKLVNGGFTLTGATGQRLFAQEFLHDHPTLQQNLIRMLSGLLYRLAKEHIEAGAYSDNRNRGASLFLQNFKKLCDSGDLEIGLPFL